MLHSLHHLYQSFDQCSRSSLMKVEVGLVKRWKLDCSNGDCTVLKNTLADTGNRKMSMSVVGMLVFVSFLYMCMRCVRSNTRSRRASASPHRPVPSSTAAKVAHPRSNHFQVGCRAQHMSSTTAWRICILIPEHDQPVSLHRSRTAALSA
jgi:hypothetical protein